MAGIRSVVSSFVLPALMLMCNLPTLADCVEPDDAAIPDIALEEIAAGFSQPVFLTHANNGDGRLYVVEQAGRVRIIDADGSVLPDPFLDITPRVSSGGERGLLSVAFHPRHEDNDRLFVNYTIRKSGVLRTRIAEFRRENDDAADVHAETVLLEIEQPFDNHNGGQTAFGPDGYLYIGMGDGGSANDPWRHGQNLTTLLGAVLRIDVDRRSEDGSYAIPDDNPYVGIRGARDEIWAHGLRNPWRFSFDMHKGILYLADVGQGHEEEIDIITPGGNYGWAIMEGNRCNSSDATKCERRDLMAPILTYGRDEGIAVTGGYVYRGASVPGLCGTYLYGDYGSGRIWGLRQAGGRVTVQRELLRTAHAISSFGQGPDGEVYVLDHTAGKVLRIVNTRSQE
jgi:glucose/arabinose dehydrogenase